MLTPLLRHHGLQKQHAQMTVHAARPIHAQKHDACVALELGAVPPMRALIPGLGGEVAEVATDKVLKKAIPKLVKLLKPDAERLLKRADRASARGRFKRAAMLRQRAKAVKAAKAKK